jgi:large conductance mechanosensitive channel
MDFSKLAYELKPASIGPDGKEIAAVTINYGRFINFIITFMIVAFAMFMVVKGMNSLKRKQEAAPAPTPETPPQEKLLAEIRDLLAKGR